MQTKEFQFSFEFSNKKFQATCAVYFEKEAKEFPYNTLLYRIAWDTHKINPPVALFYETNNMNKRFSWFKPDELKTQILWDTIARELEKHPAPIFD